MAVRFIECILLTTFLSVVGYAVGRMVGFLARKSIEQGVDLEAVRGIITRRAKIERGLDARVRNLRAEMAKLDREIRELVRRRIELDKAATSSLAVADRVVRVVGPEIVGRQLYLALVFNKYVGGKNKGGNVLVDGVWATPQEIEIWATSPAEAQIELEKRYPPSFGFTISSLTAVLQEESVEPENTAQPRE